MIKYLFLIAAMAMGSSVLFAGDKSTAQEMLAAAASQASLLQDSRRPFEMDVDFIAQFDTPRQGRLRLRWESKDRWWSKVTVGPIEQIKFQDGERTYTVRNIDFTPTQVRELMDLLHVANHYDNLVVRKDRTRTDNGVVLDCMQTERRDIRNDLRHEICVHADTREIVSDSWNWGEDRAYSKQFGDFADFAGHRYPRRLELLKNGKTMISAKVVELKETPLDPQLLVPPRDSIERRECPNIKPPSMVSEPTLALGGRTGLNGSSMVEVTILADGKVGGVHVVQSGGALMDELVVDAVGHSKYKPAMCGTEPVIAEMDVELGVRMSN